MAADFLNGEVPDRWEFTTLGEVCRRGGGSIQSGPFGSQLHASDYVPMGVPSVMPTNIGENRIVEDGIVRITEEDANRLSQHRLRAGDIVYSRRGDVEKRALIREREDGWFCGTGCLKVRLGSGIADPLFASFFLGHPAVREWIVRHAVGATMPNLNTSIMGAVPFVLPPLAEQKAIAAILGALDDKIELNRRMNATIEAMARALFQSWFVDFDPVRAKLDGRQPVGMDATTAEMFPAAFQNSSLGPIPNGWSVRDLGAMADFDKGLSYKGEGLADEGGMPMVNLGCFTGRGIFNADRVKRYKGDYRRRHVVRAGDLVIANTDMTQNRVIIGSPALVPELNGTKEFLFTHHVFAARFRADSEIWRRYVYFTLLKPEFREIAEGFSTGTTVLALPRDGLANYSLCLPPMPLLHAFEKHVSPMLAAVEANRAQSRTLATLRDTLLPKLLNGEVSVSKGDST